MAREAWAAWVSTSYVVWSTPGINTIQAGQETVRVARLGLFKSWDSWTRTTMSLLQASAPASASLTAALAGYGGRVMMGGGSQGGGGLLVRRERMDRGWDQNQHHPQSNAQTAVVYGVRDPTFWRRLSPLRSWIPLQEPPSILHGNLQRSSIDRHTILIPR